MATKPRSFTPTQRTIFEGVEAELLRSRKLFRRAIQATDNPKALEAILDAAEPVATAERAVTTALAGDLARAREILEIEQSKRKKKSR